MEGLVPLAEGLAGRTEGLVKILEGLARPAPHFLSQKMAKTVKNPVFRLIHPHRPIFLLGNYLPVWTARDIAASRAGDVPQQPVLPLARRDGGFNLFP
jgi:hypothetical protein